MTARDSNCANGWSRARRTIIQTIIIGLIILSATAGRTQISSDAEEAKRLVTMISCGSQKGAAIIVGVANDRLYLITAKHVVAAAPTEPIRVEIKGMPGDLFPAERIRVDQPLDLAALQITGVAEKHINTDRVPFSRIRASPDIKAGTQVAEIGYGSGNSWISNPPGHFDAVSELIGEKIKFRAVAISKGYSGGGLFDSQWNLIGMIVEDQPPLSTAINLNRIIEALKAWDCPISITTKKYIDQFIGQWEPVRESKNDNLKDHQGTLTIARGDGDALAANADYKLELRSPHSTGPTVYTVVYTGVANNTVLVPVTGSSNISLQIKGEFGKYFLRYEPHKDLPYATEGYRKLTAQIGVRKNDELYMLLDDETAHEEIRFRRK